MSKLETILDMLCNEKSLPLVHRDHALRGEWLHWRDCHIQPDWLLIYRVTDTEVLIARTGTHSDIFGR